VTLADLKYTQKLYAHCGPCGRSVPLDVTRLIERYGPTLTVQTLRKRITCSRCGRRTSDVRIIYSTGKR
jgi:transcription elongation factor Elf1